MINGAREYRGAYCAQRTITSTELLHSSNCWVHLTIASRELLSTFNYCAHLTEELAIAQVNINQHILSSMKARKKGE